MLTSAERRMLLEFLSKYADGDVLIQAANRVANNINDVETLRKYIEAYQPHARPEDYLSEKGKETPFNEPKQTSPAPVGDDAVEDLGPVPKKLGVNGQNIHKMMVKEEGTWEVDAVCKKMKLPRSVVQPMMALLLNRGLISRVGTSRYTAV